MNKLYIISHADHEDNYNEIPTFDEDKLLNLIKIYKQEKKENIITINVFEIDKGKIYSGYYQYDENAEDIFDDCINMKDKYWNC